MLFMHCFPAYAGICLTYAINLFCVQKGDPLLCQMTYISECMDRESVGTAGINEISKEIIEKSACIFYVSMLEYISLKSR